MRRPGFSHFSRVGPGGSLRAVSRRQFFGTSAGAAGIMLGSGLWTPAGSDPGPGEPSPGAPDPIPHTNAAPAAFGAFHFFFPGPVDGSPPPPSAPDPEGVHPNGRDPSTIFNFDGVIGQADLTLTGTGTDTTTGDSGQYHFHTDMRFMMGKFLATDGRVHEGAFAFI